MRSKGTWALLTLMAAGTLGWGGALCWKAAHPRRLPGAAPPGAPEILEWTPLEKDLLFRLDSLRKASAPAPALAAFLQELDSDSALRQALTQGPGADEVRRFKALVARYSSSPAFLAALTAPDPAAKPAPEPSCGPLKEAPKPSAPLAPTAPDGSCSGAQTGLPLAGSK